MNCYILAGGLSRRMGRSKIDLFISRIAAVARAVFDEVIAVRRAGEAPLEELPTIFEPAHPSPAPLFGVAAALEHARHDSFILAVDYPALTAELLRELRVRFEAAAETIVVPVWDGLPQMLCGGYRREALPIISRRIAARQLDLKGLLLEVPSLLIAEDDLRERHEGEPLTNVNTPEELEAILRSPAGRVTISPGRER